MPAIFYCALDNGDLDTPAPKRSCFQLLCVRSADNKPSVEFSELRALCVKRQERHLQVRLFAITAFCLIDSLCSGRGLS